MNAEISVRLSKSQIALIWTGLNHILCTYALLNRTGQAFTSYPYWLLGRPRDVDTGTFSPSMMNRTVAFCALLKERRSTGGNIELDSFQLRAAAFSTRVTLKLERFFAQNARSRSLAPPKQDHHDSDRQSIKKIKRGVEKVVKYLERIMKRAERRFVSEHSRDEFRSLSVEWRAHLRWMHIHLAYFTPYQPVPDGARQMHRKRIGRLVAMARKAIDIALLQSPDEKALRKAIRNFVHDCHLGRIGFHDFLYMLSHEESPSAQAELFVYIASHLKLGEKDMRENHGKATSIAHKIAAAKPEVRRLIEELAKSFANWTPEARAKKLETLLTIDGISIRGLALDANIKESTLRHYLESAPRVPPVAERPIQATENPSSAQKVTPQIQAVKPQPASLGLPPSDKEKLVLRRRPTIFFPPKTSELVEFVLEFLLRRGSHLGYGGPAELPPVLEFANWDLLKEVPDQSNQCVKPLPSGDERIKLFDAIAMGSPRLATMSQLEVGLKNLALELGGGRSVWSRVCDHLHRMCERLEKEGAEANRSTPLDSQAGAPPGPRTAQIAWAPHPNKRFLRE